MADAAFARLHTDFAWDNIARQTTATYERVWKEYSASDWKPAPSIVAAQASSAPKLPDTSAAG